MDVLPRAVRRLAILACLILAALPARAGEPVAVTGELRDGVARLQFEWPEAVDYDARVILERLILRFSKPGDFDLSALDESLNALIAPPRVVADGAIIAFPLRAPMAMRHSQDGRRVIVELLDERGQQTVSTAAGGGARERTETATEMASELPAIAPPTDLTADLTADLGVGQQPANPPTDLTADLGAGQPSADPPAEPLTELTGDITGDLTGDLTVEPAAGEPTVEPTVAPAAVSTSQPAASQLAQASTTAATGDVPKLQVRVGDHRDFSRLVFDWPFRVPYRVDREGPRIIVRFGAKATLDLSQYRRQGLRTVSSIEVDPAAETLVVVLTSTAGAEVSAFVHGTHLVVDVYDAGQAAEAPPPELPAESASGDAASELLPVSPVLADLLGPPQEKPSFEEPAVEEPAVGDLAVEEMAVEEMAVSPERPAQGSSDADAATEGGASEPSSAPPPGGGEVARFRMVDHGELLPGTGAHVAARKPVALRFDWPSTAGRAAVFRRGRHLWLVFDQRLPDGIADRIAKTVPDLAPVQQLTAANDPTAGVLRFNLPQAFVPELRREDGGWTVDLQPRADEPRTALAVDHLGEAKESRVLFRAGGTAGVLTVIDPDRGDRLLIVPVPTAGLGLAQRRSFPQFRALATYQGVVITPYSDGLKVETGDAGITVSDDMGLIMSSNTDRARGARDELENELRIETGIRLFDLESWRRDGEGDLAEVKQALLAAVVEAPPAQVDTARLDLARFYFAHGLATEALGVLRLVSQENQRLAIDPQVLLLRAASEFLTEDYERAAETLSDPVLAAEWEALLWQGAIAAVSRDWAFAVDRFAEAEPLIPDYDHRVRTRLWLLAAEARLGIGDSGGASLYLARLREDEPSAVEQAQLDYLEGRRLAMDGDELAARTVWEQVAASQHRPSQARARLALLDMGLRSGALSREDAIAELERLRFAWRGDDFEFVLLERLAALYVDGGEYRLALRALRQAASEMPNSPHAGDAAARMGEIFTAIFLGEESRRVAPLTALALYEEFKELTPAGREGDRLIASLSDRLVQVDLLDQAAGLLEDQVTYRLKGEEKARAGARLALIRLLDRQPGDVLTALDASLPEEGAEALPDGLERDRRYLRARALALLGHGDQATTLLAGDDSVDALRLRAEIAWAEKDWAATAEVLERLLPPPPQHGELLSDADGEVLLNLAIAYSLSDRRESLDQLRETYGTAMSGSDWRDEFALLTAEQSPEKTASIAQELAEVARVQAFMSSYKERLQPAGN